ncbi:MAG: 2Fe-2S iron-sulfur cluster-binding protein [Nanoarchaeota archaeon]
MAKVTSIETNESRDVDDNSNIKEACEELGVPFCCEEGLCGSCAVDVVHGEDNLSELTENEEILDRDKKHRLACQCRIKKGEVEIRF